MLNAKLSLKPGTEVRPRIWHSANIINDLHVCKHLKDNVKNQSK